MSDSIIEGASVAVRTMADGTLRLTVDIEPRNAQAAFALFGSPGRALALAALKDGARAVQEAGPPLETSMEAGKLKGGQWAKLAGMWCADPDFYEWIRPVYDKHLGGSGRRHGDLEMGVDVKDAKAFCVHATKVLADISSRVELDNDADALGRFNESIRWPFMKWMQARGIQK